MQLHENIDLSVASLLLLRWRHINVSEGIFWERHKSYDEGENLETYDDKEKSIIDLDVKKERIDIFLYYS